MKKVILISKNKTLSNFNPKKKFVGGSLHRRNKSTDNTNKMVASISNPTTPMRLIDPKISRRPLTLKL